MGTAAVLDPMEAAVQDAESASHYFGKVECDAQFVVLRKGERKQAWLEGMSTEGRTTEVNIRLNPLDITGLTKMVERSIISNSGEWSRTVWPSLRDLGCKSLRDAHGKFAHVQMVPSGRKWTNNNGEEVIGTTFKFVKLFELESDCIKAWEELMGSEAHPPATNGAAPAQAVSQDAEEKAKCLPFLPALITMSGGDMNKLAQIIASTSPVNKYFDVNSPEIQALLKAA